MIYKSCSYTHTYTIYVSVFSISHKIIYSKVLRSLIVLSLLQKRDNKEENKSDNYLTYFCLSNSLQVYK